MGVRSSSRVLVLLLVSAFPAFAQDNVLVIVADDVGIDRVRAYGYQNTNGKPLAPPTASIDRLASQGVLFRNAWAHPYCSPSRGAALTGRYPNRLGVGFPTSGTLAESGLRADEPTIADLLPPDYFAGVVGKWHLADDSPLGTLTGGLDHAPRCGFRFHVGSSGNFLGAETYYAWQQTRARIANLGASRTKLITQYATSRTTDDALRAVSAFEGSPWFLWVAYNAPHTPYHVPPTGLLQSEPPIPGNPLSMGKSMIEALDTEIGRLLDSIPAPVLARTTIVFFGDNGTSLDLVEPPFKAARSKGTVYNGGVHVPLIVVSPRTPAAARGSECDALVDLTDLLPTVADVAGFAVPPGLDGVSMRPYLEDPAAPSQRTWIYAELFEHNFVPQPGTTIGNQSLERFHQAARDERYKLIRLFDGGAGAPATVEEFYDLETDYFESVNLLDASGAPPAALQVTYDALAAVLDEQSS